MLKHIDDKLIFRMSGNNPDLRDKVVANRGTFKKLELLVPGLKEYRNLEDVRAADQLLRKQVSDKLNDVKTKMESLRKLMSDKEDFNNITTVGALISQVQQVIGEVQHAQQGSAGISPNIRIDQGVLNKLYEYDYNFVNTAEQLYLISSASVNEYFSGTSPQGSIFKMTSMISDFKHAWKQRLESVEDILVTK